MTHLRPFAFVTCALAMAACSGGGALQTQPDDAVDVRTDAPITTGGPDTGTTYTPGGAPPPNTWTDSTNQRCLLLFGGSDRVKSNDVGFPFGGAARTVQAWVRTNWDGEQVAVSYGRGSLRQGFTMGVIDGNAFLSSNGVDRIRSTARIDDDEWHHVAAVYDGTFGAVVIDGELDGFGQIDVQTAAGGFNVGNLPEASPDHRPWVGWIDDVRVFRIARAVDDVDNDLDGEKEASADLLAWYDFEVVGDVEGQGIIIEDLSSGGTHDGETAGIDDHPQFPYCR